MSILNAIRQQGSSIDDLSKLPQAMIMGMAQKNQIPAEMVAPILARKAEMADAVARTKAMQSASAPPTSVMEQLMQRTAEQEQPEPQAREIGVAQLPVREGMYDEQRMAGGGIVAFQEGGSTSNLPPQEPGESENAYMERVRAIQEAGSQFFNPRNYNPIAKLQDLYGMYDRNIGQPFAAGVKRFINETPEEQAAKFRSYAQKPKTEAGIATLSPKTPDSQYVEQDKNAYASKIADVKEDKKPATSTTAATTKTQSPLQKVTGAPVMPETKVDPIDALLAKYEKMIAGDPEASKQAKKDALNMRMLEAGLNIMGGQSSNFAQNVALASPAAKGYGEDIKGLRAEETAKLNQLAGLGLKGAGLKQEARKLGITEQHYKDWLKVQEQQIGERREDRKEMAATRLEGVKSREDIAMDNRIKGFADSLLKLPKYMDNPELAYADAKKMITGQGGAAPVMTYNPQTRTFK
jgi:hypothetical protein